MKRNKFNLSYGVNLTMDQGALVPVGLTEVLPGDTFQHATSALIRSSPLLAPVMHPVHVRIHHWFVPHRLVWEDWEDFITGGPDGTDNSELPTIAAPMTTGWAQGSLHDYLGVPTGDINQLATSALPIRGYQLIWGQWYMDQDLQTPPVIDMGSGPDTTTTVTLQNVCWEKDYFTTARLDPQKGPDVTLPLGERANVLGIGKVDATFAATSATARESDGTTTVYPTAALVDDSAGQQFYVRQIGTSGFPDIYADLTTATAVNVNLVRRAFALQRYEEARSRFGSRYTEYLRYLGVRPSDARLQRPEYLGGGKQTLQFSEVLQTGGTDAGASTGVGNIRGHGIGALRSNRYRRFFEEHGYIFTLMSVKPKTMYTQGVARTWSRGVKEDFFQKELQHIGQQEVERKEIFAASATPEATWGYQNRYDEYRRQESRISGEFRSTLNYWHYARIFATDGDADLDADFVNCVPTTRTNASENTDVLWVMVSHSIQARRMVAQSGTSFIY